MKECNSCKTVKSFDDFYSNGYTPNGLKKYKPICKPCSAISVYKSYLDKIIFALQNTNRKLECEVCGYKNNLSALTFHHLDPCEKEYSISSMKSFSQEKITNEINKCVVLCANCHAEEHNPHLNRILFEES